MSRGVKWSPEWDRVLVERFPKELNAVLARELGCGERTLVRHARRLGLEKDEEWRAKAKELSVDGYRRWNEWMQVTGQKRRRNGSCGRPFEKGHRFPPEIEAKRIKAIQDRAQDERLRIIRKQKRSTGWKMVDYGTWQKPKKK